MPAKPGATPTHRWLRRAEPVMRRAGPAARGTGGGPACQSAAACKARCGGGGAAARATAACRACGVTPVGVMRDLGSHLSSGWWYSDLRAHFHDGVDLTLQSQFMVSRGSAILASLVLVIYSNRLIVKELIFHLLTLSSVELVLIMC